MTIPIAGRSPVHALVVVGEPGLREVVAHALRDGARFVTSVGCAREALDLAATITPDLAVVDLDLGDGAGIEVVRRLRSHTPHGRLPILGLASEHSAGRRWAGLEAGASDVLAKPFAIADLAARLRPLVDLESLWRRADERVRRLEERDRARTELVEMIVHDQSNVLAGLVGYLDLLSLDELSARQRFTLRRAIGIARELRELVFDLNDIGRIADGRYPVSPAPVDLIQIVDAATDEARSVSRGLTQVFVDLPPALAASVAPTDATLVRRVLRNLLGNALEHGGELGRVWVSLEPRAPDAVAIAIEDEGRGIPADLREQIFERDGLAAARARLPRVGRGLGLAFSRLAARALGGDLGVEDRANGAPGARFVLRLPAAALPG